MDRLNSKILETAILEIKTLCGWLNEVVFNNVNDPKVSFTSSELIRWLMELQSYRNTGLEPSEIEHEHKMLPLAEELYNKLFDFNGKLDEQLSAYRTAEEQRNKGCEHCNDGVYHDVLGSPCRYNNCPMCGRELPKEGG